MNNWQPIETAPARVMVLLVIPQCKHAVIGKYEDYTRKRRGPAWVIQYERGRDVHPRHPTHWMHLPELPR